MSNNKQQRLQIKDIDSAQKLRQQAKMLVFFKRIMPILRPFLRLLSVDTKAMDEALSNAEELREQIEQMTSLLDKFTDTFVSRGWIMYEMMDMEVADKAVEKAKQGDIDEAEQIIVEYYSPEMVQMHIQWMRRVQAFQPRLSLAEKALDDYREERYHACIPVILMLLDGMVTDINSKHKGHATGAFTDKEDIFEAWNSISANHKGLGKLFKVLYRNRKRTTDEEITIPFRNGILHGRDLGYANKMAAAKAWAALFALRDWAIKVEQKQDSKPIPVPQATLRETIQRWQKNEDEKLFIQQWQPRNIAIGTDVPMSGASDEYSNGSPEQALVEFFTYWKRKNFGNLTSYLDTAFITSQSHITAAREHFRDYSLLSFELKSIKDIGTAMSEIEASMTYIQLDNTITAIKLFRLVHEDSSGQPCSRERNQGQWVLKNWEFLFYSTV